MNYQLIRGQPQASAADPRLGGAEQPLDLRRDPRSGLAGRFRVLEVQDATHRPRLLLVDVEEPFERDPAKSAKRRAVVVEDGDVPLVM